MITYKLGDVEWKFMELIWDNAPLPSREVVALAVEALDWKKSTTYTILRKLGEKGFLRNKGGKVTVLVDKAAYIAMQSEKFVEDTFDGSLPLFLASFSQRKKLSSSEIGEIQALIDGFQEG